jgi:glyoxylase-like metal-dependent hydrolase (beta-lactamase superfamily II)
MIGRWLRYLLWRPFELLCREYPLVPFSASVTAPVPGVTSIRIDNAVVRALGRLSGGYDYAVSYLIDETVLVDTGFPWARRRLRKTLLELGAARTIRTVVNTHYHEDHTGNNDLLAELCGAEILAHPLAVPEIRFPETLPWYRHFLFGPARTVEVRPVPDVIRTKRFELEVHPLFGHCPGHICLFEPKERWLFSGDLYIAPDVDSQLGDADGPLWIESLERAIALRPKCMFDGHGVVFTDEATVLAMLSRKRDFLVNLRERIVEAATRAQSIREISRRVFRQRDWVNALSFNDGWMSLITGSDFSRGNLIKSFLRAIPASDARAARP